MNNNLVGIIYKNYEDNQDGFRAHLGASMGGEKCLRKLWYSFRQIMAVKFDGRMLRLFSRGHREEQFFLDDLEAIGFNVQAEDANGKQFFFRSLKNAHVGGSGDGFFQTLEGIDVLPAGAYGILEFKTYNTKSFKRLVDAQSVKAVKPLHYSQMNLYMGWSNSAWAVYMAVCKDTDELYIEILQFDQDEFNRVENNMIQVVDASSPPPPLNTDPTRFECKYCDFKKPCYGDQFILNISCRSCVYSKPVDNGTWLCQRKQNLPEISTLGVDPSVGCTGHLIIPELLEPFCKIKSAAKPEDKHQYIEYQDNQGRTFINGEVVGLESTKVSELLSTGTLFEGKSDEVA